MTPRNPRRSLLSLVGAFLLLALLAGPAAAGEIQLARHPDYHSGKIVFSYQGDLWLVNEDGTQPHRLTVHRALDGHPKFSPDGKWIAFSSSRYGNADVFVIPATGGTPRRLTYHSAGDTVVGWSRDSQRVLFSSSRGRVFPGIPSLYRVPLGGGLEEPLPADWGTYASYSPDGKRLAFNRHPAPWFRKHYRGSYAADLWVMDADGKNFRRLVDDQLDDYLRPNNMWPMWANGDIYFVSDRDVMAKSGTKDVLRSVNNIWKVAEYGGAPVQVTRHTSGSVFWPSLSPDGKVIVYEENFGIWKLDTATGQTREVKINLVTEDRDNNLETITVSGECDAYHVSPSGKRAVIATHGELFSIATDRGDVRRLTGTPGARDGQPRWSPDGKWIAYLSDKSGREEVWVCDEFGEKQKMLSNSDTTKGQLVWSPDSKSLLYTASDRKLHRYSLDTEKSTTVASGKVIGFGGSAITNPQWSPDGKWISYTKADDTLLSHVYIAPADGSAEHRITDPDTYSDSMAQWTPDGKKLVYLSGADVSNIGGAGRSTTQLYVVSLVREDKAPGQSGIDSEAEAVAAAREGSRTIGTPAKATPKTPSKVDVKIDFEKIGRRARQLTRSGDSIGAVAVSPDSRSVVFVTSGVEGGRPVTSIWSVQIETGQTTRLTQATQPAPEEGAPPSFRGFGGGIGALQFTKDGRTLYYRQGSGLYALSIGGGGPSSGVTTTASTGTDGPRRGGFGGTAAASSGGGRRVNFTVRVDVNYREQRQQVFNEAWRIMKHRFYDPEMHGVDWNRIKKTYEPLLAHVGSADEVYELCNMMIGELNASHTGVSGGGRRGGRGEVTGAQTRHPGFELEADPSGLYRVAFVYRNGPADKDYVRINPGDYILAINDFDVKAGENYWMHYTTAPTQRLEFTVNSKPTKEGAWKTKITPTSSFAVGNLQYEKWVADRRALVDKLSKGEIGYLHIRQMNESSLRQFERDLMQLHNKKALVIDQRFNPGGSIDQELLQILGQRQYQVTQVRDSIKVTRPLRGFFGPMVVMANERSTSDAEVFPDGFRTLKLGKVVGVTTYGAVIGTGSYSLMDGASIRTPSSGLWNIDGTNLENNGIRPDVYIDNTPEDFLKGRDAQLEKAVEVLQQDLRARK